MENKTAYLELRAIDKHFGVTKALNKMDLELYPGEVVGLVGPNGAGKSTLMKIITGVLDPTAGTIVLDGREQEHLSTQSSQEAGIACAYQDLSLCTNLSVYENFALLSESRSVFSAPGWRKRARQEAKALLETYFPGNGIDVDMLVERLTLADRQIVEICKTLMTRDLRVLILDEPTSALSTGKAAQLHEAVRTLRSRGVAIVFISHKLDEIKLVADRIVLMKNGSNAGEYTADSISSHKLVEIMGGTAGGRSQQRESTASAEKMVTIDSLSTEVLRNISMHVCAGEIVGISGLADSGQKELINAIYNAAGKRGCSAVRIDGKVSYISGDRAKEGIFPLWDIHNNILISSLAQVKDRFLLNRQKSEELTQSWYERLKFRAEGIHSPILSLSGGNQQKALIARGIASGADLIILNDPTAGVDIETKQDIYRLLDEVRRQGKSVIFYSTEDSELEICDRAYILRDGEITAELCGEELNVSNIIRASFVETGRENTESHNASANPVRRLLSNILHSRMLLAMVALLAMLAVCGIMNPNYLKYTGLRMMVSSAVPLVFAALGQMFIVTAGDVDMGNGYSIGLVNVIVATIMTQNLALGIAALLLFILAYTAMGALIHVRNIPSIVVTLGAQFIWLGVALLICKVPGGSSPAWLTAFYKFKFPVVPMPIVLCVFGALLSWYILFRWKYGMVLRGIGNNPGSVERSGWALLPARMTNYALGALMIVFCALAYTAVCNSGDANSTTSYCMRSIASVILGGCAMAGGMVSPAGVVAGALALSYVSSLLTTLRIDSNYQTAVTGLILIAVLAGRMLATKNRR